MVPARQFLGLKHVITDRHLENMNKVILATGLMVSYGYMMEHFIAWYSRQPVRVRRVLHDRADAGPTRGVYWLMIFCNVVIAALFWFKKCAHQHRRDVGRVASS